MELQKIIIAIITAVFGGGIGYYLKYKLGFKKQESNDFATMLEVWKEDNKRLRKTDREMEKKINALEQRIFELSNKIQLMESAHQDLPLPQWLKDENGIMLAANSAYERTFLDPLGVDKSQYIGYNDVRVWGDDLAEEYRKNDLKVIRDKKPIHFIENISNNGTSAKWHVYKYPRYVGDAIIGVGGVGIREVDDGG